MELIKKIFILLIFVSSSVFAEKIIYLFGDDETEFYKGNLSVLAVKKGVKFEFYEQGKRKKLEILLSEGLGKNPVKAQEILKQRLAVSKHIIDELVKSALGEQKVIQYKIKSFPSILIDGRVFNTNNVEEALEDLR